MRRNPEVGKSLQNDRKDNEPGLYPNRNCTRNSHLTEPGPGVGGWGLDPAARARVLVACLESWRREVDKVAYPFGSSASG